MHITLRDWWKTCVNDISQGFADQSKPSTLNATETNPCDSTLRPDTISPIPEGIALLEAERIAREHEPGDGSPQKSVVEQIEGALAK